MIAGVVYLLSALTCLACAVLLFRGFLRSRMRLLMWSALCFAGLTLNSMILIVDLMIFPDGIDLSVVRLIVGDISLAMLALGLAWESP